ncbi:helix-turn-helix domain-containing protein [Microbacter margulisiae]|uniref:AraC-like DNA-binding protein n=1 Tax=Microbacter margulisiae TaxID=1350067 RepID=A0A7W5DNJ4_9PORP|nr:helix-turn-helix domain-containing protein [Microbacter margulisiae]MBB3186097.1 AraC-like DNA-binding protein [Microbacter margulisiae]
MFTAFSLLSGFLLVLFALLLWARPSSIRRANRMLAGIFLLLAALSLWMLLLYYIYGRKMDFLLPWYLPLDQVLVMFIGPLLYFYVLLLFDPSRRITARQFARHALPALPALAYVGYFISLPLKQRTGVLLDASDPRRWMENLLDYLFYLQLMPYLMVSFLKVYQQRESGYLLESKGCRANIRWLCYALLIAMAGVLLHLPLCMADDCNGMELVVGTSVIGLLAGYIFLQSIFSTGLSMQAAVEILSEPERQIKLEEQLVDDYIQRLHEILSDTRIYLNPECTLEAAAIQTNIPQHHLSHVVNVHCGKNFSDFINEYRCLHACQLLESDQADRMTIEAIGLQSGFRSKSVFYSAFKKSYGQTPFEYKASLRQQ